MWGQGAKFEKYDLGRSGNGTLNNNGIRSYALGAYNIGKLNQREITKRTNKKKDK
jgi:hypothetical protein